jgi:hypothetical protein
MVVHGSAVSLELYGRRQMINGMHAILYTKESEKVRKFMSEKLGLSSVDAGHGWLIFALPPAELAAHPAEGEGYSELYLMCDDIGTTMDELKVKGVEFAGPVREERWGKITAIRLPGGDELGLYEPKHPTAIKLHK